MSAGVARKIGRFCMRAVALTLGLAVVLTAAAAARLAAGPIRVDALIPIIEDRLNSDLSGWRVEIGGAGVSWEREAASIGVVMHDVALFEPGGARVAGAPEVGVRFDGSAALQGIAAPISARLSDADALLIRTVEGRFRFAVAAGTADDADARPAAPAPGAFNAPPALADDNSARFAAVAQIVEGLTGDRGAEPALGAFETLAIEGLRLRYLDEMSTQYWIAPNASLEIARQPGGLAASLTGDVYTNARAAPIRLALSGARIAGASRVSLSASVSGASGAAIATQSPASLGALRALSGQISGALDAEVDLETGDLLWLEAALRSDDAAFAPSDGAPEIRLDRFALESRFDGAADRFELKKLDLAVAGVSMLAKGGFDITRGADDSPIAAAGAISVTPIVIDNPDLYPAPKRIDHADAAFRFDAERQVLTIDAFSLGAGLVQISGEGSIDLGAEGAATRLSGALAPLPAAELTPNWPLIAAPGARAWVAEHIMGGQVLDAAFRAEFGGPDEALQLDFRFEDLESRYLGAMTPMTGGEGSARVTLDRFDLTLDEGRIALDPETPATALNAAGSSFAITDFKQKIPPAEVALKVSGPIASALRLIDQEPLSLLANFDLSPKAVKGQARIDAAITLPLAKGLALSEVGVSIGADLSKVAAIAPGLGAKVTAGKARLEASTKQLTLTAPSAAIDGQPAAIAWTETFAPKPDKPRRVFTLRTTLTRDQTPPASALREIVIGGEIDARLRADSIDGQPTRLFATLDMGKAALELPLLGWLKPSGAPGVIKARGTVLEGGGIALSQVTGEVDDLTFEGVLEVDADGAMRRLSLPVIRFGDRTDVSFDLTPVSDDPAAGWRAALSGRRLDLREAIDELARDADAETAPAPDAAARQPIAFEGAVDMVRLSDAALLQGVVAEGLIGSDRSIFVDVAGFALSADGDAAPVNGRYKDDRAVRRFAVQSDDAGGLLRALGYYDDGRAGRARIDGVINADGAVIGELVGEDFVVEDAPELAQILSIGTLFGVVEALRSGGVSFSRVNAPFEMKDGVLSINEAAASGPSFGITLSGDYTRATGALDFVGSVSPAFAINGLISRVPVLGDLLTGGDGEGILGVAYRIEGVDSEPDISVNPLSALAPGPFRKLFQLRDGDKDADQRPRRPSPLDDDSR